jgi:hypothetical protein
MLFACGESEEVPVDRLLLRMAGPWAQVGADAAEGRRVAPGTILIFRNNREFVEFHGTLIEQPDDALYISSGHTYTVSHGRWGEDDGRIAATRGRVFRRLRPSGPEPFCSEGTLAFRVSGNSVIGQAGEGSEGAYSPVTRLVAPDFVSYVERAKQDGVACGDEANTSP